MTTEQKALALVNAVRNEAMQEGFGVRLVVDAEPVIFSEALCRAIEAHEADKKAFSDAVLGVLDKITHWQGRDVEAFRDALSPFILPEPEPDPLVEVVAEALELTHVHFSSEENAAAFLKDIAARGYKIERIEQ